MWVPDLLKSPACAVLFCLRYSVSFICEGFYIQDRKVKRCCKELISVAAQNAVLVLALNLQPSPPQAQLYSHTACAGCNCLPCLPTLVACLFQRPNVCPGLLNE